MRNVLIAIIGITAVLPATLRAADDETLAAEFVFCSVITEFAGAFAKTDASKQYWVQQRRMYLEVALRLASKDFLRNEVPRAIERRKKLYDDSGSLDMVRASTAAALGSCESSFKANQLRIVGIAEAARAKQGSIENLTPIAFPIPDQDWTITVVSPPLTKMKEVRSPDQYQYLGMSGRLMLSLFVESPRCNKGAAHEDVYKCLSEKGLTKIPNLDSASLKVAAFQSYYRLSYDVNLPTDGGVVKHRSVHYMFSHSGKWIDLHISIVGPTDSDTNFLESFEKALHYGPGSS